MRFGLKQGGVEDLKKWHTRFKPKLSIMACQGDGIKTDIADVVADGKQFESKVR